MLIGLLSLLSAGLVVMSMGGDDDVETDAREDQVTSPDTPSEDATDGDVATDETGRQPEELVTISAPDGTALPDAPSITPAPEDGPDADRDFLVTGPEGAPLIEVGYDAETAFSIQPGPATTTLVASLNSDVQGMPPVYQTATTQEVDADGTNFTQTLLTAIFNGGADIEMEVDQEQIGTHVSQIDLSNPDASLHFNFGEDVTGNLHLITNQVEDSGTGDTSTTVHMYVIETPADVQELRPEDIESLLAQDGEQDGGTRLIAEIYLGSDALEVSGDGVVGQAYATILSNFVNENPDVTANIEWASVGQHDGSTTEDTGVTIIGTPVVEDTGSDTPDTGTPLDVVPDDGAEDTADDVPAEEEDTGNDLVVPPVDEDNPLLGLDITDIDELAELSDEELQELVDLLTGDLGVIDLNDLDIGGAPDVGLPEPRVIGF